MLFNSYEFVFAYMPLTFALLFALRTQSTAAAVWFLFGASLFFYGWWSVIHVPLLLASVVFNYAWGRSIARVATADRARAKRLLVLPVAANLLLLGYFKYANFVLDALHHIPAISSQHLDIVLPLGISFYTFTQIAFLVDASEGKVEQLRFSSYGLFVTYFPHLIAGPILHHRPMMAQFRMREAFRVNSAHLAAGFSYFCIGLGKKVLIADVIAPYADSVFGAVKAGTTLTFLEAWSGVLAYTSQLYFDFSGYSDMAIGLGLMMGISLPLNFNSPYQALSIIEFWRRWHMTLSRFLRDYLYISLGGNRRGVSRRYLNLMLTMLLGGLWHGANWTFLAWGGLHGLYLAVNHGYRALVAYLGYDPLALSRGVGQVASWGLTMLAVVLGWVLFRADSFASASSIIQSMIGMNGIAFPGPLRQYLGALDGVVTFGGAFANGLAQNWGEAWVIIFAAFATATLMPNTQYLFRNAARWSDDERSAGALSAMRRLVWQPGVGWFVVVSIIFVWCLVRMTGVTTFLYYQF